MPRRPPTLGAGCSREVRGPADGSACARECVRAAAPGYYDVNLKCGARGEIAARRRSDVSAARSGLRRGADAASSSAAAVGMEATRPRGRARRT